MTQFDGSSAPIGGVATDDPAQHNGAVPQAMTFGPAADDAPTSMLDQLRERVEARDEEELEPWVHEIPKIGVRLVCDVRVDNHDYQRWVKASFPRARNGRRGARATSAMDLDQLALSARAMISQSIRVDVLSGSGRDQTWEPITQNGEVLTLDDQPMLRAFNVMDSISLLRKLFGRDSEIINAGQDFLAAAGYLDSDDEDDPT